MTEATEMNTVNIYFYMHWCFKILVIYNNIYRKKIYLYECLCSAASFLLIFSSIFLLNMALHLFIYIVCVIFQMFWMNTQSQPKQGYLDTMNKGILNSK